jgi:hypothetical protein
MVIAIAGFLPPDLPPHGRAAWDIVGQHSTPDCHI